jgi:hypothetical protein
VGHFRISTPWLHLEISACPKYGPEIGACFDVELKVIISRRLTFKGVFMPPLLMEDRFHL